MFFLAATQTFVTFDWYGYHRPQVKVIRC